MITGIQGYTSFNGIRSVKPQKVARKVVSMEKSAPKGLSSPIRREDAIDELIKAGEKRFDESNKSEQILSTTVLSGAVVATIDFGFSG